MTREQWERLPNNRRGIYRGRPFYIDKTRGKRKVRFLDENPEPEPVPDLQGITWDTWQNIPKACKAKFGPYYFAKWIEGQDTYLVPLKVRKP